ncbi:hypothetical protein KP509_07G084100 [Ceratopteris richardii]|uniref:Uncharacterized protein n=1 Tax=Ceratopteris richardii TaxID=49495 RepID=A0A8T2UBU4_CERRI|nr:hypothetical protein KP509_07G084100 [Ceratopteris richardii]
MLSNPGIPKLPNEAGCYLKVKGQSPISPNAGRIAKLQSCKALPHSQKPDASRFSELHHSQKPDNTRNLIIPVSRILNTVATKNSKKSWSYKQLGQVTDYGFVIPLEFRPR